MIIAVLALLQADPPATDAPVQQPVVAIVLPAGTAVRLMTVDPIDSRAVKQGQRFALRVAEDVAVGTRVAIPRGTAAVGEVDAVSGKGMFGKAAQLVLRPLFIDIGGARVNLVGSTSQKGKNGTAAAAIATAITPFGLAITGKSATVPPGAPIDGHVRTDVALPGAVTAQR